MVNTNNGVINGNVGLYSRLRRVLRYFIGNTKLGVLQHGHLNLVGMIRPSQGEHVLLAYLGLCYSISN